MLFKHITGKDWYHNRDGDISSGRIAMMMIVILGCIVVLFSLVTFILRYPDSILLAGVGTTLITIGMGEKAIQTNSELKSTNRTVEGK